MDPQSIADELIIAERERKPIPRFTDSYPFLSLDTAYRAQRLFVDHHLAAGEGLVGAKLGLTNKAKRDALGIASPLAGWLTSGMVMTYGQPVPLDELIHPRAEPEIAFLLGDEPDQPATVASVLAVTSAVFAAMDVLDSRYEGFRFRLPDSVADNVGAGRLVLGPRPRKPSELEDLRLVGCIQRVQGEVVATAAGGAVMGHPAAAVAWLINALAARGERLAAGNVVMSGGLVSPVAVRRGGVISAEFDGLGTVEVYGEGVRHGL